MEFAISCCVLVSGVGTIDVVSANTGSVLIVGIIEDTAGVDSLTVPKTDGVF